MSLISPDLVIFDSGVSYRDEAIKQMSDAMEAAGKLNDKEQYIKDVFERENSASTAVGFSIATPHAKSAGVKEACLAFTRFKTPIQWDANSEPVAIAFQIAVPEGAANQHLDILAIIFRNLIHEDFRQKLMKAESPEEICSLVESI